MPDDPAPAPGLPPIPDATGHPRPPAAPRIAGAWTGRRAAAVGHHRAEEPRTMLFIGASSLTDDELRLIREHPLLEEAYGPPRTPARRLVTATLLAAVVVAQLVVIGGGYLLISGHTDHLSRPAIGGLLAAAFLAAFAVGLFLHQPRRIRAGARVVNAGGGNNLWLYQLTSVAVRHRRRGPELRLDGPFAAKTWPMNLPLGLLETNQQLWDLVYNGIRHSAAAGAQVDEPSRRLLRLPLESPGPAAGSGPDHR